MTSLLQETLCEVHTQAPPPSKDFHHLTVTKSEVLWKIWRITFRPNQEKILPWAVKKLHKDFLLDEQLQKEMQSIFGKPMLDYVINLCQEHYDFLIRMPDSLIVHILSFLNTEDIRQLSKTCKRFWKLCNTEEFWERIQKLQDKYTLDAQTNRLPAYKKPLKVNQRSGNLMQRRQTTFF
ncbi:F-box only protein 36 [Anolis carolinensis]|uniref:F-box only protein 36 n=1 Tax=Anolis carolinensis TaxID=28377 RepID=UPI002F2B689E